MPPCTRKVVEPSARISSLLQRLRQRFWMKGETMNRCRTRCVSSKCSGCNGGKGPAAGTRHEYRYNSNKAVVPVGLAAVFSLHPRHQVTSGVQPATHLPQIRCNVHIKGVAVTAGLPCRSTGDAVVSHVCHEAMKSIAADVVDGVSIQVKTLAELHRWRSPTLGGSSIATWNTTEHPNAIASQQSLVAFNRLRCSIQPVCSYYCHIRLKPQHVP